MLAYKPLGQPLCPEPQLAVLMTVAFPLVWYWDQDEIESHLLGMLCTQHNVIQWKGCIEGSGAQETFKGSRIKGKEVSWAYRSP